MFAYMCTCAYLYTFTCAHVGEGVGMSVYVCGILWICGARVVVCMCVHVSVCVAMRMGVCVCSGVLGCEAGCLSFAPDRWPSK